MGALKPIAQSIDVTQWLRVDELSEEDLRDWRRLESNAVEPNVYLSADFIVPALNHLDSGSNVRILMIRGRQHINPRLIGVVPLEIVAATRALPIPHIRGYMSPHSFLGGMLIDREQGPEAIHMLFDFLDSNRRRWHGIELGSVWGDGPLFRILRAVAMDRGHTFIAVTQHLRPVFNTDQFQTIVTEKGRRIRDIQRRLRRLMESGSVDWRIVRGSDLTQRNVDTLLSLEDLGWKGRQGTSMASNPRHVKFFSQVIANLTKNGRVFFAELLVNGTTIASTCNFISNGVGHAFKIGWDPGYKKYAPGFLCEYKLVENARVRIADLNFLESGGSGAAYLGDLWTDRRPVQMIVVATTTSGRIALQARTCFIWLRSFLARCRVGI